MKAYVFRIIVEPDEDRWVAYSPTLKTQGGATWGYTQEEALENIRQVLQMTVSSMMKHGESIPEARLEKGSARSCSSLFFDSSMSFTLRLLWLVVTGNHPWRTHQSTPRIQTKPGSSTSPGCQHPVFLRCPPGGIVIPRLIDRLMKNIPSLDEPPSA